MHTFSVSKKMDYSAPILFVPYSAKATKGAAPEEQQKPTATIAPKIITPKPKTIVKPTAEQKKATSIAVIKPPEKKIETKGEEKPSLDTFLKTKTLGTNGKEKITESEKPNIHDKPSQAVAPVTTKKTNSSDQKISLTDKQVPENAQISNNYRQVEALRRGAQLQKELVKQWHPPIGVSSECTCDVSFFVNKCGTIEQVKMIKSSGVIMFDISARQALFAMKMPQWAHGKSIVINFKQ